MYISTMYRTHTGLIKVCVCVCAYVDLRACVLSVRMHVYVYVKTLLYSNEVKST